MKSFNFVKKESKKTDLCVNYRDKFVFFCNSSKGITLIALVVSIIVILILACIAINVTIGKDGIISKSQNAKLQEYESEVEFEVLSGLSSLDTEYYTKTTADSGVNVYSIYNVDGLQKYVSGKINGFNYNKDGTTTVYYTNSNGTYTVKIDQAGVATTYSSFQVQENEVVTITMKVGETISLALNNEDSKSLTYNIVTGSNKATIDSEGNLTKIAEGRIVVNICKSINGVEKIISTVIIEGEETVAVNEEIDVSNAIEQMQIGPSANAYIVKNEDNETILTMKGTGKVTESVSEMEHIDEVNKLVIESGITEIDDNVKIESDLLAGNVEEVSIPNTLQKIGTLFAQLSNLKKLNFNAENLELGALNNNTKVEEVNFGNDVKVIPNGLLNCGNITDLYIPDSVEEIGDEAFNNCVSLVNVYIGNSVKDIGSEAFDNCIKLANIYFGYSVENIENDAFEKCTSLTNVDLSNTELQTIGESAFKDCIKLATINLGDSLVTIGINAFANSTNLTNIDLPDSVETIGSLAFYSSGLEEIDLPDSVKTLGVMTFYNCENLNEVTLDENLTQIGNYCFKNTDIEDVNFNCINLQINDSSDVDTKGLVNKILSGIYVWDSIENLNFGDKVEVIANNMFHGTSKLATVTLPDSVTTIGANAFNGCSDLSEVNIGSSIENVGTLAFQGTKSNCVINISRAKNSISTTGWGILSNRINWE